MLNTNRPSNIKTQEPKKPQEEIELIENIIKSGNSIYTYRKTHNIEEKEIEIILLRIKKYSLEMHNEYIELLNRNKTLESEKYAALALQMEKMIESGVDEQDYIREFDILDYYMIAKTDPKYFVTSASKSLEKESQILNLRVVLSKSYHFIKKAPFNEKKELNAQNRVLVNGEERLITKEEKQEFIDYLRDNDIPVTNYTYQTMKLRFINKLTGRNIKMKTYS